MRHNSDLYDGLHVTYGPLRGRLISSLNDQEFCQCRDRAYWDYEQIKAAEGYCYAPKHRGKSWKQIQLEDYPYWLWMMDQRWNYTVAFDDENDKRAETQQQQHPEPSQAAQDPVLFDDEDQRLIQEHQILDRIHEHWRTGYRQAALAAHPDRGGTDEAMRWLNFEKRIWEKIRDALSAELNAKE